MMTLGADQAETKMWSPTLFTLLHFCRVRSPILFNPENEGNGGCEERRSHRCSQAGPTLLWRVTGEFPQGINSVFSCRDT